MARLGLRCLAAQAPLTNKERKARRAEAQRLGKSMCTLNIGKVGPVANGAGCLALLPAAFLTAASLRPLKTRQPPPRSAD